MSMKTSPVGLNLIKEFEGYSATKYICPAGKPTIGYGHLITKTEELSGKYNQPITKEQATELLAFDVREAETAIRNLVIPRINQNQFDALVSFVYNVGMSAFKNSTMLKYINNNKNIKDIKNEFYRWVYANNKKLDGLVRRRDAEATLYATLISQALS